MDYSGGGGFFLSFFLRARIRLLLSLRSFDALVGLVFFRFRGGLSALRINWANFSRAVFLFFACVRCS